MQGASPSSNLQPPPRPVTPLPPRRAPLGEFQGGFPRPSQPRQANAAAAPGASYSPPPSPAAPPPRPVAPAPPPQPEERRPSEGHADNPLARSYAEEESKTPENLSFDFGDDSAEEHHLGDAPEAAQPEDRYDRWRVGDAEEEHAAPPPPTPEMSRYQARRAAIAQTSRRMDRSFVTSAEPPEHGRMRSSGFFLGLFVLIVIGFGIFTFLLGVSPSLSRELLTQLPVIGGQFTSAPARQNAVSLADVHAEYRVLDGHRRALIVSGRAENRGAEPLHTIEVGVSLVDNQQHPMVSQSVFCGDLVSPKIVSQMTPHELQFFQKLAPPKNFALKSGDSSPFFVMFIDPPPKAANFQVSVLKAEPASGEAVAAALM